MPVHEPRQVLPGERALLPGDRRQHQIRIGDDPRPVAPRDLQMLRGPLGILAPVFPPRPGRADLVLRLQRNPLRVIGPMIDPQIMPKLRQPLVRQRCPPLPPFQQQLRPVPLPDLPAETVRPDRARRQHHMRMRLRLSVRSDIPMHVQVRHHPAIDELLAHEIPRQPDAVCLRHLARNRELHLTGKLRIATHLNPLHLVPQHRPVQQPRRRTLRQQHLRMHHAGLVGEVVRAHQTLVFQLRRRAIGRRCNRAPAAGSADHLRMQVVDRHARKAIRSARRCHAVTYKRAFPDLPPLSLRQRK